MTDQERESRIDSHRELLLIRDEHAMRDRGLTPQEIAAIHAELAGWHDPERDTTLISLVDREGIFEHFEGEAMRELAPEWDDS
jgi:hypothetical protein